MSVVVSRYANALFQIVCQDEKMIGEIQALYDVVSNDQRLMSLLKAPNMKKDVISAMTEDISSVLVNFCRLLLLNNRLDLLEKILKKCLRMVSESNNEINISVTSVLPLSEDQLQAISDKISSKQKVNIINVIDKSILGGIVIKRNYNVIDLSLKNKLDQFQMISKEGVLACN